MEKPQLLVLRERYFYDASLCDVHQLQRDTFHGKKTVALNLEDYLVLARTGNTLEEWGVGFGLSAYFGEHKIKSFPLSPATWEAKARAMERMHSFYNGLIDQAATFAQQSGAPYFGVVVQQTIPHRPIMIGGHEELPVTPRNFGPDMIPLGTPKTEWVLHPTVNLYVPRER